MEGKLLAKKKLLWSRGSSANQLQTFTCPRCGNAYKHRASLEKHLRLVCDVEYKCPYCEFICRRKDELKQHVYNTHQRKPKDGHELHRCPKCNNAYHYRRGMLRHLRLECGVEPQFRCPFCPHRSKLKFNLKDHLRRRHSDIQFMPIETTAQRNSYDNGD